MKPLFTMGTPFSLKNKTKQNKTWLRHVDRLKAALARAEEKVTALVIKAENF